MNIDRFTDLLDAWGADPALWPDAADRKAAQTLLAASTEAQRLQREAAAFETLLQRAPLPVLEPSAALRQRILRQVAALPAAIAPAQAGWRSQIVEALGLLFPTGRAMPQFAALALALAIGVSAGFANFGPLDAQETDLVGVQIASIAPLLSED
jgi:hypothetical protein